MPCGTPTEDDPNPSYTFTTAAGSGSKTFWAWTGSLDDELDEDTVRATLEDVARPVGRAGPDYARISGGLPTGDELAKMGETVSFTVQLHSDTSGRDGSTLDDDAAVGPDRTGNVYLLQIQRYHLTRVLTATDSDPRLTQRTTRRRVAAMAPSRRVRRSRLVTASTGVGRLVRSALPGDWNFGSGFSLAAGQRHLPQLALRSKLRQLVASAHRNGTDRC